MNSLDLDYTMFAYYILHIISNKSSIQNIIDRLDRKLFL